MIEAKDKYIQIAFTFFSLVKCLYAKLFHVQLKLFYSIGEFNTKMRKDTSQKLMGSVCMKSYKFLFFGGMR